jgi:hypothetical protein
MCRNIHVLHNLAPATTSDEVRAAALQYVRKVSGSAKPSQANRAAFDRAVEEVAHATEHLLADLVTTAPPRDREVLAAQARERAAARYPRDPVAPQTSGAQRGPLQQSRAAATAETG